MGDEIEIQKGPRAVFTFGRFNPPTMGHKALIEAVIATAMAEPNRWEGMEAGAPPPPPADAYIFPSSTLSDPRRNPLSVKQKIAIIKRAFPDPNLIRIIDTTDKNSPILARRALAEAGYTDITLVVGEDERGSSFSKCMPGVKCVVAPRPEGFNSENLTKISGTKVREAALKWLKGDADAKEYFAEGLMVGEQPYTARGLEEKAGEIVDGMERTARSATAKRRTASAKVSCEKSGCTFHTTSLAGLARHMRGHKEGGGKRPPKKLRQTRRKR
jgi:nicotinic acid mononucleotide adenylyltransferase